MTSSEAEVAVSVVVIGYATAPLLERCLAALVAQSRSVAGAELIVAAPASHQGSALTPLRDRHPEVRWLLAPPDYTVARLRGLGIGQARGERVALLEGDCVPADDWLARLVTLRPAGAVGGAIEPGSFGAAIDWAAYLSEFAAYMVPLPAAPDQLPGTNVLYRRSSLPEPADLERDGFYETFVHASIRSAGGLSTDSGLVVHHQRRWRPGPLLRTRFHHGRGYAALRVRGRSVAVRLGYLALAPGLPLLLLGRQVREVLGRGRFNRPVVRALPWLALLALSWSAGEMAGYAAGPGRSLDHWR